MATATRLSFAEFLELPEAEGVVYELGEGELLMEASPTLRHNLVRQRNASKLMDFVEVRGLGIVVEEMDFRLKENTVRNPDVAFIANPLAGTLDQDRSPLECAPTLCIEVISPGSRAEDVARKIQQYLNAGTRRVWVVYPSLRMVEIHDNRAVRQVREPDELQDPELLPGFTLSLPYIFDGRSKQV